VTTLWRWLGSAFLVVLIFAGYEFALFMRAARIEVQATGKESRELISESRGVISQVNATTTSMRAYADSQMQVFNSTANRKSQQAAWDAAASLIRILREVQQHTVPDLNKTITDLDSSTIAIQALVSHTDESMNAERGLLPESTKTIAKAGVTLDTLNKAIQQAADRANAALDAIYKVVSDPDTKLTMDELLAIMKNVDDITDSFKDMAKYAPTIAASVDKMARTSSKLQKFVIGSQIISALARIWF
jgi:hypothetical protein